MKTKVDGGELCGGSCQLTRITQQMGGKPVVRIAGQLVLGQKPGDLVDGRWRHHEQQQAAYHLEDPVQPFEDDADLESPVQPVSALEHPPHAVIFYVPGIFVTPVSPNRLPVTCSDFGVDTDLSKEV